MALEGELEPGGTKDAKTPMTKARAAEILYDSLKFALMQEGIISEKDHAEILADFREDVALSDLSDQEIIDFVEFLKNDVNNSLQLH